MSLLQGYCHPQLSCISTGLLIDLSILLSALPIGFFFANGNAIIDDGYCHLRNPSIVSGNFSLCFCKPSFILDQLVSNGQLWSSVTNIWISTSNIWNRSHCMQVRFEPRTFQSLVIRSAIWATEIRLHSKYFLLLK